MAKVKLSPVMVAALRYTARTGYQGSMQYENRKTEDALISRGLVTYDHNVKDRNGDAVLYSVITVVGWEWLKENFGTERPADEGRMSLDEAWDAAVDDTKEEVRVRLDNSEAVFTPKPWISGTPSVIEEANRLTADKDAHARRMNLSEALKEAYTPGGFIRHDFGSTDYSGTYGLTSEGELAWRYTMDEALEEAYTPRGQVTCKHGRGLEDTCDDCFDRIRAGTVYEEEVLRRTTPEHRTPNEYQGVPLPSSFHTWDIDTASAWRWGVDSAQRAAELANPDRSHPRHANDGHLPHQCPVCKWRFTTETGLRRHEEGHAK